MDSTAFQVIALISIAFLSLTLFLALFEPHLPYKIVEPPDSRLDSEEFLCILAALADAQIHRQSHVEVLTNSEVYYEAELAAIREASHSINIEAYIFEKGEITSRFVRALTERARSGVRVNIVIDAIGSFATRKSYFKELMEAGGRVEWYHPLRWYTLPRINNRTHREIIVIDGKIGFVGGSGFADHWWKPQRDKPRWRDTMFRVEGGIVTNLQSAFAENWVEASGELLAGTHYFPFCEKAGSAVALIVDSSPSSGRSTRGRMLYQLLMASAREKINITTPYFLPDASVRKELVRAMKERGVEVSIITPGAHSDHLLTRRSSRRLYGELLKAGAKIYEYQPGMIHTKSMTIDALWAVVGTTNFDHRSFTLNDEVNLATVDERVSLRLDEDFAADLAASKLVTYEMWKRRPLIERVTEFFGGFIERQQ